MNERRRRNQVKRTEEKVGKWEKSTVIMYIKYKIK